MLNYLYQPLEQFEIFNSYSKYSIISNFFVTNFTITCIIVVLCFSGFLIINFTFCQVRFTKKEFTSEIYYLFILNLIYPNSTNLANFQYFIVFSVIFGVVLLFNLFGLVPFSFTVTSHFFVTLSIAFINFFSLIIICIYNLGLNFVKLFLPTNVPNMFLFFFIVFIEILSYIIRPFSLAIRLFANMLAGHTLLYLVSNFTFYLISVLTTTFVTLLFICCCLGIYVLEFFICFIQAYVFTILIIIFFSDILKLTH